jgi:hypothetical protein
MIVNPYPPHKPNFGPASAQAEQARGTHPSAAEQLRRVLQEASGRTDVYVEVARAARLKATMADCLDPRMRHLLDLIAAEMACLISKPYDASSWASIAGYVRVACMLLDADGNLEQRTGATNEQQRD